ncbi:MAG: hypothetical protein JW881_21595 [Spirochaetales bacterium]|nr:hypothetical protein [Spirochaetales bacterium]
MPVVSDTTIQARLLPEVAFRREPSISRAVTGTSTLSKAKTLLYRQGHSGGNTRAVNLIRLAETALKNGNSIAAEDFARKAIALFDRTGEAFPAENDRPNPVLERPKPVLERPGQTPEIKKPEQTVHTYKDSSSDAGVSFSYPAQLSGSQSFLAVPAHEYEHVRRRIGEATMKGERVMVLVSYKLRFDPQTGQAYLAGGRTRTISLSKYKPVENARHRVDVFA